MMKVKDLSLIQQEVLKSVKKHIQSLKTPAVERKVEILINADKSCDMKEVMIGGKVYCAGNDWDFHPGATGLKFYFDGCDDLVEIVKNTLVALSFEVIITHNKKWKSNY